MIDLKIGNAYLINSKLFWYNKGVQVYCVYYSNIDFTKNSLKLDCSIPILVLDRFLFKLKLYYKVLHKDEICFIFNQNIISVTEL